MYNSNYGECVIHVDHDLDLHIALTFLQEYILLPRQFCTSYYLVNVFIQNHVIYKSVIAPRNSKWQPTLFTHLSVLGRHIGVDE